MYKDVTFYDDINEGKELDKDMVMKARKLEMKFFKKMGVYKKVYTEAKSRNREEQL